MWNKSEKTKKNFFWYSIIYCNEFDNDLRSKYYSVKHNFLSFCFWFTLLRRPMAIWNVFILHTNIRSSSTAVVFFSLAQAYAGVLFRNIIPKTKHDTEYKLYHKTTLMHIAHPYPVVYLLLLTLLLTLLSHAGACIATSFSCASIRRSAYKNSTGLLFFHTSYDWMTWCFVHSLVVEELLR